MTFYDWVHSLIFLTHALASRSDVAIDAFLTEQWSTISLGCPLGYYVTAKMRATWSLRVDHFSIVLLQKGVL